MIAAAFALVQWIPQFAQTASEPVTLAIWGGALIALGASLRGWSARRSTQVQHQAHVVRNADRRLNSNVVQAVEG
jgi:hypothetical protein